MPQHSCATAAGRLHTRRATWHAVGGCGHGCCRSTSPTWRRTPPRRTCAALRRRSARWVRVPPRVSSTAVLHRCVCACAAARGCCHCLLPPCVVRAPCCCRCTKCACPGRRRGATTAGACEGAVPASPPLCVHVASATLAVAVGRLCLCCVLTCCVCVCVCVCVRVCLARTHRFGFVVYWTREGAQDAVDQLNGLEMPGYPGRKVNVRSP
jgi:hypothetical protein